MMAVRILMINIYRIYNSHIGKFLSYMAVSDERIELLNAS
jgi:hypothetical protein